MDFEYFFKRIEAQYQSALPFVAYRKPAETEVKALFQKNNEKHTAQTFTEKGFVFSPFNAIDNTVLIPLEVSESFSFSFSPVPDYKHEFLNSEENPLLKQQHINLVEKGIEAIKANRFKKVVLSRTETVPISETSPIPIFKRLLQKYSSAFVYCWYHPKVGLWLGATPETLIKIEGQSLSIMALAGTQSYNGTLQVNWQEKEIQEQKFVTDFIVEQLSPLTGHIKISATETVKAGNLVHLKNNISARLKTASTLTKIISVLHPTPAVCGYPKNEAKHFILKNEGYNRTFYSGFLGELNFETTKAPRSGKRNIENRAYAVAQKSTQLYVNLRCMQIAKSQAVIYVGGGITKDSNAESEWRETEAKSLIIRSVL
ncbi:MAG: chorismate-binding protein [Flavobacteriaceae bacterium]